MSESVYSTESACALERRLNPRHHAAFSCVQLDEDNGGVVLDASERGLSIQVVRPLTGDQSARIRFQLSRSRNWIETRARIVWVNRSRTLVGLEFDGLPSDAQILLKHWISSIVNSREATKKAGSQYIAPERSLIVRSEAATAIAGHEAETRRQLTKGLLERSDGLAALVATPAADSKIADPAQRLTGVSLRIKPLSLVSPRIPELSSGLTMPAEMRSPYDRFRVPLALCVSLLVGLGVFSLSGRWSADRVGGENSKNIPAIAQPSLSAAVPQSQAISTTPQEPPSIAVVSERVPGFFLQAGAMKDEENAFALARSLQQKQVPVLILKDSLSHFCKVLAGPYPDVQSASATMARLKEQGFPTILDRGSSH